MANPWPSTNPPQVAVTSAVAPSPTVIAYTDRSGAIAAGNTAQQAMAANAVRKTLIIENVDASEDLWFNFGVVAVIGQPSFKLLPGGSYSSPSGVVSGQLVSVIAATTGHQYTAKEA